MTRSRRSASPPAGRGRPAAVDDPAAWSPWRSRRDGPALRPATLARPATWICRLPGRTSPVPRQRAVTIPPEQVRRPLPARRAAGHLRAAARTAPPGWSRCTREPHRQQPSARDFSPVRLHHGAQRAAVSRLGAAPVGVPQTDDFVVATGTAERWSAVLSRRRHRSARYAICASQRRIHACLGSHVEQFGVRFAIGSWWHLRDIADTKATRHRAASASVRYDGRSP